MGVERLTRDLRKADDVGDSCRSVATLSSESHHCVDQSLALVGLHLVGFEAVRATRQPSPALVAMGTHGHCASISNNLYGGVYRWHATKSRFSTPNSSKNK